MRVRRCVSACTWVALLLTLSLALAVPSPAPPPVPASAVAPAPRAPDPAVPAVARGWPVGTGPAVLRGWEPPSTPYGPGHRGVDLAAPPGAPVRAVAPGRVSFAGRVAGKGVVSVELTGTGDPPLRTTFEPVRASVKKGRRVAAGDVLGTVEATAAGTHCTAPCLHWGLLRGDVYLNPLSLLPTWLLNGGPARLLPVLGVPLPGATGHQASPGT
ncbi:M23 family metallopeptidase [Streptomyces sp. TRM S81-3]|uniref:M23 family metallopeptidase n=1 Tax=Streptomyces griseicoloratus TaxID=2752516 RepID=A0A926QVG9_9ACTN|nr:M23 family metallopeptidase [Streptomyces griseicoloratus]MBD0424162.1 M23 family metallopeptidase [Streptomyces griseicoloratus]